MIRLTDGTVIDPITGTVVTRERLVARARAAASEAGVDVSTFLRMIEVESGFNPQAYNASSGATGIGQALRSTAAQPGFGVPPWDPDDPEAALVGAARYLRAMVDRYGGDYRAAVAAYNAGPGTVDDAIAKGIDLSRITDPGHLQKVLDGQGGQPIGGPGDDADDIDRQKDQGGKMGWKPRKPIQDYDIIGNRVQVIYDKAAGDIEEVALADFERYYGSKFDPATGKPVKVQAGDTVSPNTQLQVGQQDRALAENRRQFDLQQGQSGRQFDQTLDQRERQFNTDDAFRKSEQERARANDEWQKAVNNRDFAAAEFWKKRTDYWTARRDELERLSFNENTRQFEAGFGEGQRQFDTTIGQRNADRDVQRGTTLLNLAQRPETFGRYLYGLRGEQAPQGFDFGTSSLPGFGPNAAAGALDPRQNPQPLARDPRTAPVQANPVSSPLDGVGAPATGAPPPGAGAPPPGAATGMQVWNPTDAALPGFQQRAATDVERKAVQAASVTDWQKQNAIVLPGGQVAFSAVDPSTLASSALSALRTNFDRDLASGLIDQSRYDTEKKRIGFADGGRIPEPVVGLGLLSGETYTFGEEGPETVVPAKKGDKVPKRKGGVNSRAGGGLIGTRTQGRSIWNPLGLAQKLSQPFLSPGVPNFPQYAHFTGGTSLLPSAQRFMGSTPTERGLFAGFLQDEAGVNPGDAFDMIQRMAPRGNFRTRGYAQ